ncbi:signal peptidase I [Candidatus Peregrinibacteria bacterium]|nr:signal peptidase I [Candidatus Peregrinibacteria bacterium]
MHKNPSKKSDAKRPLKEIGLFLADILYNAVIIIVLVVLIRTFLISPFRVIGSSMADTLKNNEFILIDKLNYHLGGPERGDTVVFLPPITNKYPHKFEESIVFDAAGEGILPIADLKTGKNVFYCQNPLVQTFWFCQDRVEERDLVYYRPVEESKADSLIDRSWKQAEKKVVTGADIQAGQLTFWGQPGQSYLVRIYSSAGPEYFVKRIIGIPGDTIRIENGRVYLKTADSDEFAELEEVYLNDENAFNTYFKKTPGMGDFVVPEGYYFVLGDNRSHSNDSRHWFSPIDEQYTPFVDRENINGKVLIVLWPPTDLRLIPAGVLEN